MPDYSLKTDDRCSGDRTYHDPGEAREGASLNLAIIFKSMTGIEEGPGWMSAMGTSSPPAGYGRLLK
jgi:hypothetical protein